MAIAAINLISEEKIGTNHIKMSKVTEDSKLLEKVSDENLKKFDTEAKGKFVK